MIVLGVAALALVGIKIVPMFLPRSMRMRMRAKKMGLPPPAPAPSTAPSAPAPAPVVSAPAPAAPTISPAAHTPSPAAPASPASAAPVMKLVGLEDYFEPVLKRGEARYLFDELPNFFISKDFEETASELLHVQLSIEGILWDEENPLAIVNDRIYSAGDYLDENLKILKIGQTFIIITDEKEQRRFEIK